MAKKTTTKGPSTRVATILPYTGAIGDRAVKASQLILERTHESAGALLKAFNVARSARQHAQRGGMTTDEEQDILRAMLVMAAAGVDAMTKQLVRDALPRVIRSNANALDGLQKYVGKQFQSDVENVSEGRASRFVAAVLAASTPGDVATREYIKGLTSGSLQSAAEMRKIASAFGLTSDQIQTDFEGLKRIFLVRNKIIHELDINLDGRQRKRNIRARDDMVAYSNALLAAAGDLLRAVDKELASGAQA